MRKIISIASLITIIFVAISCADIAKHVTAATQGTSTTASNSINIGAGLKEALRIGTDTAVSKLNITDGYFKDELVKILLPNQIEDAISKFKAKSITYLGVTVSGNQLYNDGYPLLGINALKDKEDELVLGINRAAELAASEAKPIFVSAITTMSIQDANSILFGTDTAATQYLRKSTYTQLFEKFEPKIDAALKSVKIGEKPVSDVYENFIGDYNKILNTAIPSLSGNKNIAQLMGLNTMTATDISEYSTKKGLDGLFLKVVDQEKEIRKDPKARVTDLLKDVFGKLDD